MCFNSYYINSDIYERDCLTQIEMLITTKEIDKKSKKKGVETCVSWARELKKTIFS